MPLDTFGFGLLFYNKGIRYAQPNISSPLSRRPDWRGRF